jgi:NADH-quinone oxidoreductase subunit F
MEQILFRHNKPGRCVTFAEYQAEGALRLQKALASLTPDEVQQLVIDSGLRGRGGAGFPTGKKWSFVPRNLPGPRWLICNCDEMEPGTYKDRILLEANPYSLVEGITLACYALGVRHAFIFIRRGYEQAAANLRRASPSAERPAWSGRISSAAAFPATSMCMSRPGATSAAKRPP